MLSFTVLLGQDLGKIGKAKLFKYSGGLAFNTVFYEGNSNRDPFSYFINGNVNLSISEVYSVPISFSYSNQGFEYSNPFTFNRLSIHPSYKWISTHIGDVSMSFSPYTLSGHQFTGLGVDLTPKGSFKMSFMYGRLLKATEYNPEEPSAITAYKRNGMGLKMSYKFKKLDLEFILFKAKDESKSLKNEIPTDLELTPKDNAVLSGKVTFPILSKGQFFLEYAYSGITEDIRADKGDDKVGLFSLLLKENSTTNYYKAIKGGVSYTVGNGTVGAGYEWVDPNYRTFGAYYFDNDLENVTVNANQTIFNNKLNIGVNAGLQKDNLDNSKASEMRRIVGAVNLNYTPSEKLSLNGGYSNFQSHTNIRDQFDYINQVSTYDNIDTLNYKQVTQNANLGINYVIKKSKEKEQTVNFNILYQDSKNFQEQRELKEQTNDFYNTSASYTIGLLEKSLRFTVNTNLSYNIIGFTKNITWGPTLSVTKQFLDKKLRTQFSTSYNRSSQDGENQNSIMNFRLGANYKCFRSHFLNLNLLSLHRFLPSQNNNDLTVTFGYNYTFSDESFKKKEERVTNKQLIGFRFDNSVYRGTKQEVSEQLRIGLQVIEASYLPVSKQKELKELLAIVQSQKENKEYKQSALLFLKYLKAANVFQSKYKKVLHAAVLSVKKQVEDFERKQKINLMMKESLSQEHQKIQKEIIVLNNTDIDKPTGKLKDFIINYATQIHTLSNNKTEQEIILFLEKEIILFYDKN